MSAQVAADLRTAADVLEQDGWTQETYGTTTGCKCVYGALHYVASCGAGTAASEIDPDEELRADEAAAVLADVLGVSWSVGLVEWNDAEGRTASEVIAALRAAADRAEAEQ